MSGMIQVPFGDAMVIRPAPAGPVSAYKTYGMSMPVSTHWRPASCEEAACIAYSQGWVSTFDLSTELGQKQYHYCTRVDRDRSYTEQRDGTLVSLTYPPGTPCFGRSEHKVPLDRPSQFYVADGDFRGFLSRPRVHRRAEDWVDDMSSHLEKVNSMRERG